MALMFDARKAIVFSFSLVKSFQFRSFAASQAPVVKGIILAVAKCAIADYDVI